MRLPRDLEAAILARPDIVVTQGQPLSTTKPVAMTEKEFQAQVVAFARSLGYRVYHTHDSRKSAAGYPDLTIVGNGRVCWLELKTSEGRATAAQLNWIDALHDAGQHAAIVRPDGWGIIREMLE